MVISVRRGDGDDFGKVCYFFWTGQFWDGTIMTLASRECNVSEQYTLLSFSWSLIQKRLDIIVHVPTRDRDGVFHAIIESLFLPFTRSVTSSFFPAMQNEKHHCSCRSPRCAPARRWSPEKATAWASPRRSNHHPRPCPQHPTFAPLSTRRTCKWEAYDMDDETDLREFHYFSLHELLFLSPV